MILYVFSCYFCLWRSIETFLNIQTCLTDFCVLTEGLAVLCWLSLFMIYITCSSNFRSLRTCLKYNYKVIYLPSYSLSTPFTLKPCYDNLSNSMSQFSTVLIVPQYQLVAWLIGIQWLQISFLALGVERRAK